ncbi:MAG: zinc-dependent metalloprotease [Planctomycetes bacterium]|nr:zinc-dependent metalloprotease [Planctomycetota bacterium]
MRRLMRRTTATLAMALVVAALAPAAVAQNDKNDKNDKKEKKPDFPEFKTVSEGFEKVISTTDGKSFYTIWKRDKDAQLLAELPQGYDGLKHFIATTIAAGDIFAGLQIGDRYVYWKRYDKRVALIEPEMSIRATGDPESISSVKRIWTDKVLLDVPIVCIGPGGQPVIDMDAFLTGSVSKFFRGAGSGANASLARITKAKAFPENVEIAIEMPVSGGRLRTFHYSIIKVKSTPGFKPRHADQRVGYFHVGHSDLGKYHREDVDQYYIARWPLQKRDSKLKMSPPKEPIIYYIENTVPVRYRRYVKQGIEYWNRAYENIGILDAIEVRYQDKETGAHMDKDPEDVRYNFIRWLNNNIGVAIGPSRAHPETGEIFDADVVLTDGWIRAFWYQYNDLLPETAMEGMSRETISWLDTNPMWDPRIRLAPPEQRAQLLAERARRLASGQTLETDTALLGNPEAQRLAELVGRDNALCMAARGKAMDMAMMGMHLEILNALQDSEGDDDEGDDEEDETEGDLLDGIPDWFVGPMLADLVAHEVGHTLGLRHNFKASSAYTLEEINSEEFKGTRPYTSSVMDYNPININMDDDKIQGDYTMIDIGPYDMWAIEYGYTFDDPEKVLERASEPELLYGTDGDTGGSDPRARRYDFSRNPLDYARNQISLSDYYLENLMEKFVKDGDGWDKVSRGYRIALRAKMNANGIVAGWLGGTYTNRLKKGDSDEIVPITPVSAEIQRAALELIIDNTFNDETFGLTPELLRHMTASREDPFARGEEAYSVHDRILGVQASALTQLLNPTTLRRVYDNEFRVPANEDAFTLPELMTGVTDSIWTEIDTRPTEHFTAREPMISSIRRDLQGEHMERLIDLSLESGFGAANKAITDLARMELRKINDKIQQTLKNSDSRLDPYTVAHLTEAAHRITRALDAAYVYNTDARGGMGFFRFFGFQPTPADDK